MNILFFINKHNPESSIQMYNNILHFSSFRDKHQLHLNNQFNFEGRQIVGKKKKLKLLLLQPLIFIIIFNSSQHTLINHAIKHGQVQYLGALAQRQYAGRARTGCSRRIGDFLDAIPFASPPHSIRKHNNILLQI